MARGYEMRKSMDAKYIAKGTEECFKCGRGRIHSLYHSAINLLFGERIITLLSEGRSILPYGIVLKKDSSKAKDFTDIGVELSENDPVFADDEGIHLPNLLIRIAPALPVNLNMIERMGKLEKPEDIKSRLKKFADIIYDIGKKEGLSVLLSKESLPFHIQREYSPNVWSEFLAERIRIFLSVLESLPPKIKPADLISWGEALAGCGPGLSPASDDFLTGIFAGLYGKALSGELALSMAEEICRYISEGAIPKTTFISAQFLRQSGKEKMFSEDVIALIENIYQGDEKSIAESVRRVAAFGSTSGSDIMTGIYFALSLKY